VHLASKELPAPPPLPTAHGQAEAVIILAPHGSERYSMRAVARRHVRLAEGAGIEVPPTAVPFVFLAEKARYRAAGGRAPGTREAEGLASRLAFRLAEQAEDVPVSVASSEQAEDLAWTVARHVEQGASRIVVVALCMEDSDAVDRAKSALERSRPREAGVSVSFGPSVWQDTVLASRLARRITEAAGDFGAAETGAVLVSDGTPPVWEREHDDARTRENYFNQRVRMTLTDAGLDERTVRISWLQWQSPDVTEAIRHVAALGGKTVIVAPSTIALPSLDTAVDLDRAVSAARLPNSASMTVLDCWAGDEGFDDAVYRSARTALETARNARR
jgi:protoheme ferro-lyase